MEGRGHGERRGKVATRIDLCILFRFGRQGTRVRSVAAVEVPLRNLGVKRDEQRRTFAMYFSAPGLIRDARGQVVYSL